MGSNGKLIALSHSRLNDFNQCPLKFRLKYLDKAPNFNEDVSNSPHLIRGSNVHKALENYVIERKSKAAHEIRTSTLKEVSDTLPTIESLISGFKVVEPESQICVDSNWNAIDWFSKDAYLRAIFDLICLNPRAGLIVDYKTGKFTDYTPPNGYGQLELSAAIALCIWPALQYVDVAYLYVDHKKKVQKRYTADDRIRLVEHFEFEHRKVNETSDFCAQPNQYCKWCPATKEQCNYSRKVST